MSIKKRLYRSNSDTMVAGICGGIAEYFALDPTLVRLGYVFLTFFTAFAGVIAYFVMWFVIPKKPLSIE